MDRKARSVFACQPLRSSVAAVVWRCPGCGGWNTCVEEQVRRPDRRRGRQVATLKGTGPLLWEIQAL